MSEAENIWEQTMKKVIGEDQPENAADVIRRLQDDLANERSKRRSLQLQNQGLMMNQKAAGLCISYALEGKSRTEDRWWMGEMDRVRELVAERDAFENTLSRPMIALTKENMDLKAERDALAARVERLEGVLRRVDRHGLESMKTTSHGIETTRDAVKQALSETQPAALARVKAEAINDARRCIAIVSHARDGAGYVDGMVDADTQWNDKLKACAQRLIDEAGE